MGTKVLRLARGTLTLLTLIALTFGPASVPRGQAVSVACGPKFRALCKTVGTLDASATHAYRREASKEALSWADAELKRMTLDEKAGQLISIGINARFLNEGSDEFKELRRQVERNHIGGIILFRGPIYESVHLVNRMQQFAREPLLISADLEAGSGMRFDDATDFPWNMAVGATGNPVYARREGELTAREARALGVEQILAPDADVNNNAANPVINVRSFGEDPAEVARFVAAFIEGAQSNGVIATAKHFPGHGDTATDSHRGLPVINVGRARLDAVELVPFRAAIKAGVGAVMSAHIGLPQIDPTQVSPLPRDAIVRPAYAEQEVFSENAVLPGTLSPVITGSLLRRDLGFDGIVVTDALDMSGLTIYFKQDEAGVRAVLAGADMLLKPGDPDAVARGLRDAVKSGRLTEARIEESARKILAAKYDLGLVKERVTPLESIDRVVSSPEALKLADEVAERAITLVRDDAKLLQRADGTGLRPGARLFNLAVTNGEDRFTVANPFVSQLVRSGRRADTLVLDSRSSDEEVNNAIERARKADVVIVSMYGRVRSGAANSVGIPAQGARVLSALLQSRKPVVGISFGNPYLLENFPALQTYVVAYGDMPSLQRAAARALLGQTDITGRLPISLPGLYPRGTGIQLKASPTPAGTVTSR
ncbi:MAG TPA: glycoside hydrolase family 3 N-terminal domain-containing protein [Pyrinomonadaceae bacterium]|jgi:beta-N-acetylhexosaminidase|nr:glycoside hydrolase family 3 N-terminal domain-containing protein [Pyrinomonadaceae bacterium]